jgi:hypothetical protein
MQKNNTKKSYTGNTPEHRKLIKAIIYKLSDKDDPLEPVNHFTLAALKNHAVNVLWPKWDMIMGEGDDQDFTQVDLVENDEYLFTYLDNWGYTVERIIVFGLA